MYTRRFNPPARRPITPPPDYSGTAIRVGQTEGMSGDGAPGGFSPPPALTQSVSGGVLPSAVPDYARVPQTVPNPPETARETARETSRETARETLAPEGEDPRLGESGSRRPDLAGEPQVRRMRFTRRAPLRGIGISRPGNSTKRPLGLRPDEAGYKPRPRRTVLQSLSAAVQGKEGGITAGAGKNDWALDDLLLLGLIFLLLNGEEDGAMEHLDIVAVLGFLFFVGMR